MYTKLNFFITWDRECQGNALVIVMDPPSEEAGSHLLIYQPFDIS